MAAGRVVLWRHGQTDYNLAGRLQGQVDIPLNATGRMQAEAAAGPISRFSPVRVVASDLGRAVETASMVAGRLGLAVFTDERLRERSFGDWEGLSEDELAAGWPVQYEAWRHGTALVGIGAESRGEVGVRFAEAVVEHASLVAEGETLLVVAHGACIGAGITSLLGLDAEEWAGIRGMRNCHWCVMEPTEREPHWRLTAFNVGVGE